METQTLRKVSFQQQTVTSTTATEKMTSATTSMQETQALERSESTVQQGKQDWHFWMKTFSQIRVQPLM